MKRIIFSFFICTLCCLKLFSQNVGVGNTNPQARLDIAKPGGDTPTLNIRGSVNLSQFNFGSNEDTYIRGGKSSSHLILNDNGSGRVGIGMSTPGFPLNFAGIVGDKISLYGNTGSHYGFGIQNGQLQIHTDGASSDILFGYGSSNSFTERMRIKGNGNVGIGTNAPVNRLDIAGLNNWDLINTEGDVRIGSPNYRLKFGVALGGGGAGHAAIMQSGGLGILSLGANSMSLLDINGFANSIDIINNARLRLNGDAGQQYQVLQSNGPYSQPTWGSPTFTLYAHTTGLSGTSVNPAEGQEVQIPGTSRTFQIDGNAQVAISIGVQLYTNSCIACNAADVYLKVYCDGVFQESWYLTNDNAHENRLCGSTVVSVGPGLHTFTFTVQYYGQTTSFSNSSGIIQAILN